MQNNILFLLLAILTITGFVMSQNSASNADTTEARPGTEHLTPQQKYVTLQNGTEPPFRNEYWDHKEQGIYVDVINGEALFSSTEKFDSGSGWPAFTGPIQKEDVAEKADTSHGMLRSEVRSQNSDAHLGHVFDHPDLEGDDRWYCINSASLRFVHKDEMAKEGYEEYLYLFDESN